MKGLHAALTRHFRFYTALAGGLATWEILRELHFAAALLAGGVVFYLVFLAFCIPLVRQKPSSLKKRAKSEDEGIAVVIVITLATMAFFCTAVFMVLAKKQGAETLPLVLALVGAPLGWLVLHTVMAFHYADLHYFEDPDGHEGPDLQFPGRGDPGPWDFLYFSFVIGMTAQVSDVQVTTTPMRKLVLMHGIGSFFFNTVILALAVNAGLALGR